MAKSDERRMMVRLSAEDRAWVEEQAADEGVEAATFVRMIVNRLRRGRAPLLSRVFCGAPQSEYQVLGASQFEPQQPEQPMLPPDMDSIVEARLGEVPAVDEARPPVEIAAAVPRRRVERARYNPGRTGTGG